MTPILEARGLAKSFGRTRALDSFDLTMPPGVVTAVLGPNGAGKTTLVRSAATLVRPDRGSLHIAGVDAVTHPAHARRLIGLAGQHAAVDPSLTGRENLELVARLFGLDRRARRAAAGDVLERLGLTDDADRPVRGYSGGMRRRIDLGASLVGAPRLLLLDEPTTGLDPRSRNELWEAIRSMVQAGTDVLLTTQYLDEADQLAGRIVIVDGGRVIAEGTPDELKRRAGRDVIELHAHDDATVGRVLDRVRAFAADEPAVDVATRRVTVPVDDGPRRLMDAMRALDDDGLGVADIALRRPTLDEVFLALTGRDAA